MGQKFHYPNVTFFEFPELGKRQTGTVRRAQKDGDHEKGPESPKTQIPQKLIFRKNRNPEKNQLNYIYRRSQEGTLNNL